MLFLSLFDQDKAIELVSTFTFCFIFNMFKVFKQHAYDTNTLFEEDTSKMYLLANIKKKEFDNIWFSCLQKHRKLETSERAEIDISS